MNKEELRLEALKLAALDELSGGDPERIRQLAGQFWDFISGKDPNSESQSQP